MTPAEFLTHTERQPNGCLLFTRCINQFGYGWARVVGFGARQRGAHRIAYEMANGPIPAGLWIDHICHNGDLTCTDAGTCLHRRCVEPTHLEAVTPRVNVARSHLHMGARSGCIHDHPYTPENTRYQRTGTGRQRVCRACQRGRSAAYRAAA